MKSHFFRFGGLRASSLEAPGLHDTNFNTPSTQTPRGQELLERIKEANQNMAVFFFIINEKGFKFHARPQLAHILVINHFGPYILPGYFYEHVLFMSITHVYYAFGVFYQNDWSWYP